MPVTDQFVLILKEPGIPVVHHHLRFASSVQLQKQTLLHILVSSQKKNTLLYYNWNIYVQLSHVVDNGKSPWTIPDWQD